MYTRGSGSSGISTVIEGPQATLYYQDPFGRAECRAAGPHLSWQKDRCSRPSDQSLPLSWVSVQVPAGTRQGTLPQVPPDSVTRGETTALWPYAVTKGESTEARKTQSKLAGTDLRVPVMRAGEKRRICHWPQGRRETSPHRLSCSNGTLSLNVDPASIWAEPENLQMPNPSPFSLLEQWEISPLFSHCRT